MAETRSKTFVYLIGEPQEKLLDRVVPTCRDVLKVYFHYHKKNKLPQKEAVKVVVEDLLSVWARARIPVSEKRNVIRKFETLLEKYRKICRNKLRGGTVQLTKETEFSEEINLLFDISHQDAANIITIKEDHDFLMDQRTNRKYVMGAIDKDLANKEERRKRRDDIVAARVAKEEERKRKVTQSAVISSSSNENSDMEEIDDDDEDIFQCDVPSTSKCTSKQARVSASAAISPGLLSTLDRTNVSDRKAAFLLCSAAQSFTCENASTLPLSASSIRRIRMKHRSAHAQMEKELFSPEVPLVVHFDGKLLPAISSGHGKEDRIAVLVSGFKLEKLLGVPKVIRGTGENIAEVVHTTVKHWNIQDKLVGMSFDTTASNTGHFKGACILLEKKLGKRLLWLACRHHIFEVVCGDVFHSLFGATTAPNIQLFKRFQEHWSKIRQDSYEACDDPRLNGDLRVLKNEIINFIMNILERDSNQLPREDYKELLELTLIFFGKNPPHGVKFRAPGAFHHARWMSKLLYVFKIHLFRNQFTLSMEEANNCMEFSLFVSLIYTKAWITCPNTCDASINDLNFIQAITNYKRISQTISVKALTAMHRHLWYLSEELTPLGLFSDLLPVETKKKMAGKLKEMSKKEGRMSRKYTAKEDLSNSTLDYFIGPASHLFFEILHLDTSFLDEDVETWKDLPSFNAAKGIVQNLRVVNDTAERGIALASTFNSLLTTQEDQKQYLLQVVEDHRKRYPKAAKAILFQKTENDF
jgi:hypothetical protein